MFQQDICLMQVTLHQLWTCEYLNEGIPRAKADISFSGIPLTRLFIWLLILLISSCTGVVARQGISNFSLMAFPSFASATNSCSWVSFVTFLSSYKIIGDINGPCFNKLMLYLGNVSFPINSYCGCNNESWASDCKQ